MNGCVMITIHSGEQMEQMNQERIAELRAQIAELNKAKKEASQWAKAEKADLVSLAQKILDGIQAQHGDATLKVVKRVAMLAGYTVYFHPSSAKAE